MRKINFKKFLTYDYYLRKEVAFLKRIGSENAIFAEARRRYYWTTGKKLDYRHPKDISEKLMWLTRYDRDPLKTQCADKYLVRDYVQKKGLGDLLIPLLGVWDHASDIDFSTLPDKFVLKCNHGSGWNVICTDKETLDIDDTRKKLDTWLGMTYGVDLQEVHYFDIPPKIVCEEFMPVLGDDVVDYKFHCSRGKVHSCFVAYDRSPVNPHQVCYDHYDIDWNRTDDIKEEFRPNRRLLPKPPRYEDMLKIASTLSEDFNYVRVDLYNCGDKIFFGELTFTPYSGIQTFYRQSMLDELGRFVSLKGVKKKRYR